MLAGSGSGFDAKEAQKTAQARSAYLQAQADNELAILKLKNQMEESEDKRSYDAGLANSGRILRPSGTEDPGRNPRKS